MPARIPHLDRAIVADGFVILEGFLERRSVDQLRRHIDAELARPPMPGCERPHNRLVPLGGTTRSSISFSMTTAAALYFGMSPRAMTCGGSLPISVKEPGTPALWWHQDWWCWDHPVSCVDRQHRSRFSFI